MAISPLPQETINLLGSAQAITTPISLVKELLDNALDAKATSVDILISHNTLDKIEVRDNGQGIQFDDLKVLGRRGCTSKITSFEEVKSIGGISLGFRGEALASAVQLGEVSVTTKTDGEAVATCVKLKIPGGIASQTRVSHSVGTTVSVKNFFSKIPVRKQTALKAAPKSLVKIKELLQAYALARPTIRFSLKVAKESKGSWSFSPRPNSSLRAAVTQVIGREAAAECVEECLFLKCCPPSPDLRPRHAGIPSTSEPDDRMASQSQFEVELFLPKKGADLSKISCGQYISIDSRPIQHDKGTMRKVVALFKNYIKSSTTDSAERVMNPFLRMNIKCPKASYDPNIEPAKDDVLFENESFLLDEFEIAFKGIYGVPHQEIPATASEELLARKPDDFVLLLARKPELPKLSFGEDAATETSSNRSVPATIERTEQEHDSGRLDTVVEDYIDEIENQVGRKWDFHMSEDLTESSEPNSIRDPRMLKPPGPALGPNFQTAAPADNSLNPWSITKMASRVQRGSTPEIVPPQTQNDSQTALPPIPASLNSQVLHHSKQTKFTAGFRRRRASNPVDLEQLGLPTDSYRDQLPNESADSQSPTIRACTRSRPSDVDDLLVDQETSKFAHQNGFITARDVSRTVPMSPPVTQRRDALRKSNGTNKPFVSPLIGISGQVSSEPRQTTIAECQPIRDDATLLQDQSLSNTELVWAMDYEQRKEEFSRHRREEIRAARAKASSQSQIRDLVYDNESPPTSSPHKNRYEAAVANLRNVSEVGSGDDARLKSALLAGDPRLYLIEQQRSMSSQRHKTGDSFRHMKSSKLPLEKVPESQQLHALALNCSANIGDICRMGQYVAQYDTYIRNGNSTYGSPLREADQSMIIQKIRAVAISRSGDDPKHNIDYDFLASDVKD